MTISCIQGQYRPEPTRSLLASLPHRRAVRCSRLSPEIRIFLCDDVPELRTLLRYGLEEDPGLKVVGEAGDAQTAIAQVRELQPDVVLLDLSMPGMDGLEAIPHLMGAAPGGVVVIFS